MRGKKHHNVYVIELSDEILRDEKFSNENPGHKEGMKCLYVGMTGLDPEKRFENHLAGYKSNRYVRRFGIRLCPLLYEEYNPLSYRDACEMEIELARILRRKGYGVWQK
ncbi:MAG: hypothetical protein JW814_00765 [Candidatus Krumholzibacteriota bacterium]|nr:hypothetical protein [Candidatus Krumholzibacteriota bacterium]